MTVSERAGWFLLYGLALLPAIMLGCAVMEPAVRVDTRTVSTAVSVPVPVACVAAADLPPYPAPTIVDPKTATTDQLAAAAANDAEVYMAYSRLARALLAQCAQVKGGPK